MQFVLRYHLLPKEIWIPPFKSVFSNFIIISDCRPIIHSLLCFLLYCWKVYFYILFPYWYCVDPVCLAVYERAVRNCPWSHTIWADYIRSLERFNKEHSVIVKVFEECLSVGFNEPGAYLEVGVWNVFSDLFSLNFIVLFLNTLKLVSKLVSKKVYTALKVWHTIMVLVFFLLLGLVGLCWLYATAVRFWGGRDAIHAGTESNLWQGDGAFEQVIERDGYGLVGLISVSHWIILFPVVFLHAFHVNILNVKLTKEQVFQWEHGGVTSRPLRKLWQTDQPTDWLT